VVPDDGWSGDWDLHWTGGHARSQPMMVVSRATGPELDGAEFTFGYRWLCIFQGRVRGRVDNGLVHGRWFEGPGAGALVVPVGFGPCNLRRVSENVATGWWAQSGPSAIAHPWALVRSSERKRRGVCLGDESWLAGLFVSYSRLDRDFVKGIEHRLLRDRIPYWLDTRDIANDQLETGEIHRRIHWGITSSSALALVLSRRSTGSAWVKEEIRSALDRERQGMRVVSLVIDPDWRSGEELDQELVEQLERRPCVDFCRWHDDSAVDDRYGELLEHLDLPTTRRGDPRDVA